MYMIKWQINKMAFLFLTEGGMNMEEKFGKIMYGEVEYDLDTMSQEEIEILMEKVENYKKNIEKAAETLADN